ncbi:hypothetical protein JCM10207_008182 [Rhodosporidiobolus poonsookiae]
MQAAPRLFVRSTLRNAGRSQASQPAPFSSPFGASAAPSYVSSPCGANVNRSLTLSCVHRDSSLYSFHPSSASATASSSSSTAWTPSTCVPTSFVRSFSTTAPAQASEAPQNPFDSDKFAEHAPLFERIAQSPEVLDAIENMARITHEKTGVDLQGGQKPTLQMMMQLARDPDLRAAAERLMAALKNAGIDVDPRQALQALQMMGGEGFDKLKGGLEGLHDRVRKGGWEDGEGEGKK